MLVTKQCRRKYNERPGNCTRHRLENSSKLFPYENIFPVKNVNWKYFFGKDDMRKYRTKVWIDYSLIFLFWYSEHFVVRETTEGFHLKRSSVYPGSATHRVRLKAWYLTSPSSFSAKQGSNEPNRDFIPPPGLSKERTSAVSTFPWPKNECLSFTPSLPHHYPSSAWSITISVPHH